MRGVVLQHEVDELRGQPTLQQVATLSIAGVGERKQDAKVLVEAAPVHVHSGQHLQQRLRKEK